MSCTPDRPRDSAGTRCPAQRVPEDTRPHTGACGGGEVLHSSGSGWRSTHRTHSPAHSYDTPDPQGNPCGRQNRDIHLCTDTITDYTVQDSHVWKFILDLTVISPHRCIIRKHESFIFVVVSINIAGGQLLHHRLYHFQYLICSISISFVFRTRLVTNAGFKLQDSSLCQGASYY